MDSLLPMGRGQRQLILGDRYTGKTSIFITTISSRNFINIIGGVDGIGTKQLICLYLGININSGRINTLINTIITFNRYTLVLCSHSSSSSLLSYQPPSTAIGISEALRDRGFDIIICSDDLPKHPKS